MSSRSYLKSPSGTVYVYESSSYWDKDLKKTRTRKKYLGKLDQSGNIVPTARERKPDSSRGNDAGRRRIAELEAENESLRKENEILRSAIADAMGSLSAGLKKPAGQ